MASLRLYIVIFLVLHVNTWMSLFVHGNGPHDDEDEKSDDLLDNLSDYRNSLNLPALTKNYKAMCLANRIAVELEDQPCSTATEFQKGEGTEMTKINNFGQYLKKCKIKRKNIVNGIILPICSEPKMDIVFSHYLHSDYVRYVNDSKYVGAGVGSDEDWTVLILCTTELSGDCGISEGFLVKIGILSYFLPLVLGLLMIFMGL